MREISKAIAGFGSLKVKDKIILPNKHIIYDVLKVRSNQLLSGCDDSFQRPAHKNPYCIRSDCCQSYGESHCKLRYYEQNRH